MIQKVHSKKPVFKAHLFTVNELQVEIKPGVVVSHHNAERRPFVEILPITNENEVYLISQYRYNLGQDVLECVAGYINDGEEPLAAAKRELQEETGLSAKKWITLPMMENGGSSFQTKIYPFIAKGLSEGETCFDEAEDIKTMKISLEEAIQKVLSGEIHIVSSVSLLLHAYTLLQKGTL